MVDPERVAPAAGVAAANGGMPTSGRPVPTWGLPDAAVGWLLAQIGAIVTFGLVLGVTGEEADDLSLGWVAIAQVGLWLGFLLVPWFVSRLKGNGLVADFGLRAEIADLRWIPAGFVLQIVLGIALYLLYQPIIRLTSLTMDDINAPVRELTDRATDPFSVAMLVLIVGIGAPVFEELFYRGLVLRSVQKRYGANWGIAVSGLVFGISHFNWAIPVLIVFGVVVGIMTVRSGRLGPAIAIHIGFNLTTVVFQLA